MLGSPGYARTFEYAVICYVINGEWIEIMSTQFPKNAYFIWKTLA